MVLRLGGASDDPRHHYLIEPRATAETDGMRIWTLSWDEERGAEFARAMEERGRDTFIAVPRAGATTGASTADALQDLVRLDR